MCSIATSKYAYLHWPISRRQSQIDNTGSLNIQVQFDVMQCNEMQSMSSMCVCVQCSASLIDFDSSNCSSKRRRRRQRTKRKMIIL